MSRRTRVGILWIIILVLVLIVIRSYGY